MKTKNVFCFLFVLMFFSPKANLFSQNQAYDITWEKHDVDHGSWKIFCSENTLPASEDGWIEYTLGSGNVYLVGLIQEGNNVIHPSYEFSVGYNTSGIEMFGNGYQDRLNLASVVGKTNDVLRMERKSGEMIYSINGEERYRVSATPEALKAHFLYPFSEPTFLDIKASFSKAIDNDNDGYTSDVDCDDNNPEIGGKKNPGTACDDNDLFTLEDVIQEDSCMCMGVQLITLGCVPPTVTRIIQYGPQLVLMDWGALAEASSYTIQVRYKGDVNWVATQTLRKNKVFIRAPLGSYEYRLKSNCDNEISEYGEIDEFAIEGSLISNAAVAKTNVNANTAAEGRSNNQSIPEIVIFGNFSLSPNPVESELTINYPEVISTTDLVVFSQINVADLTKGFYFISLVNEGRTMSTKKFIKL